MPVLQWKNLVAQECVKNVLESAFQNKTLGHAYLFSGERGVGKFAAALDLAMTLLCQNEEAKPCGVCSACKKVESYSHPDFHLIMPLLLQAEHKKESALSEQGWQYAAACAKRRIDDPYKLPEYGGIPDIPVDWMREAVHAIQRGAVDGEYNVTIMDGVESLKKESANTILKTLEEPPPGTVIIALTDRINYVLPTIVSRCQTLRFSYLAPDVISARLCSRFNVAADDSRIDTASAGGSLGAAISEFEAPETEWYETASAIWAECAAGDLGAVSNRVDALGGGAEAYGACQKIFKSLLRLLRIAFLEKFGSPVNYFNCDTHLRRNNAVNNFNCDTNAQKSSAADGGRFFKSDINTRGQIELPDTVTPGDAEKFIRLCQEGISALESRGNSGLVLVNFLCSLTEILDVKKQQTC